ncbi:hypothetical protein [Marinomonas sp.]|uniref:hypothetical protein n=1 Tax=Marinomonas sp. TaxID=1904862 RepID=UPI003BAA800D
MSISSVSSSNPLYLPSFSMQGEARSHQNSGRPQDPVQLSDHAKQQLSLSTQTKFEPPKPEEKSDAGKESVQISSSVGRLSRITGLQREEVAALYRSIDKLT